MSTTNPLIDTGSQTETIQQTANYVGSLLVLLAESPEPHNVRMFNLLRPASQALTYLAEGAGE